MLNDRATWCPPCSIVASIGCETIKWSKMSWRGPIRARERLKGLVCHSDSACFIQGSHTRLQSIKPSVHLIKDVICSHKYNPTINSHLAAVRLWVVGWLLWSSSFPRTRWKHGALSKHKKINKNHCTPTERCSITRSDFINTDHYREFINVLNWLKFLWQNIQIVARFWPEKERQ